MNSYELSRNFVDFGFENPSKIKPNHYALYFFAIEHCNRLGWKKEFGLPTTMAMEAIGIKSYNTYINTFSDLESFGFISIIEKSRNQYSSNIIALSNFNKALDKALDKAFIKHTTKQSESTQQSIVQSIDSISKQINNKQLTINKEQRTRLKDLHLLISSFLSLDKKNLTITSENKFSTIVYKTYETCLTFFGEHLRPKDEKQKNNWLETIEKLERIDKIPFEQIIEITKKTRANDFWSKNFLSLVKLRKKDKNQIQYIVVFNEQIKSNTHEQSNKEIFDQAMQSKAAREFRFGS